MLNITNPTVILYTLRSNGTACLALNILNHYKSGSYINWSIGWIIAGISIFVISKEMKMPELTFSAYSAVYVYLVC